MNFIISISLCFLFITTTFAQKSNSIFLDIYATEIEWSDKSYDTLKISEKTKILQSLAHREYVDKSFADGLKIQKIDLNFDGKLDVLCRIKNTHDPVNLALDVLMNINDVYVNEESFVGIITSIEQSEKRTNLRIKRFPCCCMHNGAVTELKFKRGHDSILKRSTMFWHTDFEIPEKENLSEIQIKTTLQITQIRTYCEVNDSKIKDDCTDDIFEGNVIGAIKKNAKYKQLSHKTDQKGNQWELIEVLSPSSFIYQKNSVQPYSERIIGWIKKNIKNE
ncbi:hypothetical protein [Aquimarina algicola]|uniref:Uncharacterized protein n=1 Tax=Aquimarina algicola TaxID=2589995 RepID=A0A504J9V1_9FLAO|nr:hypothetical protein [Aquimarina algicola]TPN85302.1 hypothetical protein FHK87_14880 [Aquimarina algicola]